MGTPSPHVKVVIVGGGLGGVYAARGLAHHGVEVAVVVEANGCQTLRAMPYQAATGIVALDAIMFPISELRGVEAITDTVTKIDCETRMVRLASGGHLTADDIVVARGSAVNYFRVDGAAEHAYPLYTAAAAARIGSRWRELFGGSPKYLLAQGAPQRNG